MSHCAAGTKWLTWLFDHRADAAAATAGCPAGEQPGDFATPGTPAADLARVGREEAPPGEPSAASPAAGPSAAAAPGPCSDADPRSSPAAPDLAPQSFGSVQEWFKALVRAHFRGALKGPFNEEARRRAGFDPSWYRDLSSDGGAAPLLVSREHTKG